MMLGGKHNAIGALAVGAVFALYASASSAQDAAGLEATLTFSQGLTYSDTDGVLGRTNLGFALQSSTRTQDFEFTLGGAIEESFDDGISAEIQNPRVALSYGIQSRQTAITTNLSYRQSDADSFVEDDDAPGVLVLDDGTREDFGGGVGLTFGREARFGGTVNLRYRETDYTDTTSASLVDLQTYTGSVNLRFEIDQRITATLGYSLSDADRVTGRDVVTENLSAGAQLAITPALDAALSVGLSRVSVTNGGTETVEDGLSYGINITQDRPNGSLRYSLESDVTESGRRTTATVGTSFETRRGEWRADVGLTEGESDRVRPLLTLNYGEELRDGRYSVSFNQRFATDTDGDETLNSRLRLNWRRDLNNTSRISSNLTYQITDVLGANEDTSRLELGVGFSHDLTEDWALTTRLTHSFVDEDGSASTRENEIFVGLETSVGWRP
ncbi:hypothetical protein L0666_16955 [Octadecabacter sp. CECT 8868]|uniref:hypothetical protein n=1 Tax=Octadecabacter algicola TaxID=2909342 RepID=UPI001F3FBBC5|nr:hypothetical protein [Octadecabacter algicola]MCF2906686.1 hypothetical protein [Octadecabacter algicola]